MTPGSWFKLFMTSAIVDLAVVETNRYAREKRGDGWNNVTSTELYTFIALVIYMGIYGSINFNLFFDPDPCQLVTFRVAKVMTRQRFKDLAALLHFTDNSAAADDHADKLEHGGDSTCEQIAGSAAVEGEESRCWQYGDFEH